MGIIFGALGGLGKGLSDVAEQNAKQYGQEELQAKQAEIQAKRDAALADMHEKSTINAEGRGLMNRAQERAAIVEESIANAPRLRDVKVEDYKASKMAEYDPEIQALSNKAKTDSLTSEEQTKLDFYKANEKEILDRTRNEARAKHIDDGAGLRAIQMQTAKLMLEEKQAEMKMPPAVKAQAEALREQIKAKVAVIDKATVDGMANPEGITKLQKERDALSSKVADLYAPYIPDDGKPRQASEPEKDPFAIAIAEAKARKEKGAKNEDAPPKKGILDTGRKLDSDGVPIPRKSAELVEPYGVPKIKRYEPKSIMTRFNPD
jgi:hypothetical protein